MLGELIVIAPSYAPGESPTALAVTLKLAGAVPVDALTCSHCAALCGLTSTRNGKPNTGLLTLKVCESGAVTPLGPAKESASGET